MSNKGEKEKKILKTKLNYKTNIHTKKRYKVNQYQQNCPNGFPKMIENLTKKQKTNHHLKKNKLTAIEQNYK